MDLTDKMILRAPKDKIHDRQLLASLDMVPTNNSKGYMFLQVDSYVQDWLSSLPESDKPLLDMGCAYGVHTLFALRHGRDVIAVDMEHTHLSALRDNVAKETNDAGERGMASFGRLVDTQIARLPNSGLFEGESVSGALLSEVMHFFQPGEPLQLFVDVYRWLVPGGHFVISVASASDIPQMLEAGLTFQGGSSAEELNAFISQASDEELVRAAPTYGTFPSNLNVGEWLYYFTLQELAALARISGFNIKKLEYFSPQKYLVLILNRDEAALLVAQKPFSSESPATQAGCQLKTQMVQ